MESHRRSKRPARLNISELPSLPGHRTKSYLRGASGYCGFNRRERGQQRAPHSTRAFFSRRLLTMQLSGARSPRHRAMALDHHCLSSLANRRHSCVRFYDS
jgi:hypothetical protein